MKAGFLVFCLVVAVSLPRHLIPLGFAGGSVDGDWFDLGANLATFGVLGFGHEPLVYRAPGFPAFVALILKLTVNPATHDDAALNAVGPSAVLLAQSFLLGLGAFLLYLWLSRKMSRPSACAAAIIFGTNAYSLSVATLIHYDVLNWVLLLAFLLVLEIAFEREGRRALTAFLLSGMLLALAVLVRPVTLLAPLPLLAVFLIRRGGRAGLIPYSRFLLGFALLLLPWTARNFAVASRLIPVNAQGWTATFVSTAGVLIRNPDVYEWNIVGRRYYLPLYQSITGENEITTSTYARQVVKLEDAARNAAFRNIREHPHIYLANFVTAATSLVSRVNAVLLTAFLKVQTRQSFDPRWIAGGQRANLIRGPEGESFQFLHDLLLLAGLFGVVVSLVRRDWFLLTPVVLFGAIVLAHALSYLDFYYYAIKIPFLLAFGFCGVEMLPKAGRLAMIIALIGLSLALTWTMGFVS